MKTKNWKKLWAMGLIATVSPLALADDRQDTIIVTSPGPDRSSDELIGNATALDRADVLETLSGTLGDTLASQPGVSSSFYGAGASRPILRGLGAERVLVLNNGIGAIDVSASSPDHQVAADGIDAQRIEILRGPAALAYGGQAIGGVVNVIDGLIAEELPEKPVTVDAMGAYNSVNEGNEFAAFSQFKVGDFVFSLSGSTRDFGDYHIPGYAESAAFRALEEEEHHDDEDEDHDDDHDEDHEDEEHDEHEEGEVAFGTLENSYVKTGTLASGLSWVGNKGFVGFSVKHTESEYGLPGGSHAHGEEHGHEDEEHDEDEDHEDEEHEEGEEHGEEELIFIDMKQTRYDFRAGWAFEHETFKEINVSASYADYEHKEFEGPEEVGVQFNNEGFESRVELTHEIFGLDGAVGAQFVEKDVSSLGAEAFLTPTEFINFGVFIFETLEFDSGAGFEGGLRIDNVELSNQIEGTRDFDLVSASLGAHKHWENGLFVGVQLAQTDRAPNETELFANGPHFATNQFEIGSADLGKERALNLEGAIRWQSPNFEIGLNIFHTNFDDFIYLTPSTVIEDGVEVDEADGLPVVRFAQSDAEFSGGEIYLEQRFDDALAGADWKLNGAIDWVDAELSGGENVPFIPPLTFKGGVRADWKQGYIRTDLILADEQKDVGEERLPTEAYTQLNIRGGLNLDALVSGLPKSELFVDVDNINDEEIRYSTSVLRDTVPAQGRNIKVGLRLNF